MASINKDWYEHRHELEPGQVFSTSEGIVKLDRGVPGDGTKWYVENWSPSHRGFFREDDTIEPGDLIERLPQLEG